MQMRKVYIINICYGITYKVSLWTLIEQQASGSQTKAWNENVQGETPVCVNNLVSEKTEAL